MNPSQMRSGAVMILQSGRFHTRACLAFPVKLINPQDLKLAEDAITENVSPLGARVLVKARKEPEEPLILHSLTHGFRTPVRVVYCEPLPDGQFAAGLHLQGLSVKWANIGTSSALLAVSEKGT